MSLEQIQTKIEILSEHLSRLTIAIDEIKANRALLAAQEEMTRLDATENSMRRELAELDDLTARFNKYAAPFLPLDLSGLSLTGKLTTHVFAVVRQLAKSRHMTVSDVTGDINGIRAQINRILTNLASNGIDPQSRAPYFDALNTRRSELAQVLETHEERISLLQTEVTSIIKHIEKLLAETQDEFARMGIDLPEAEPAAAAATAAAVVPPSRQSSPSVGSITARLLLTAAYAFTSNLSAVESLHQFRRQEYGLACLCIVMGLYTTSKAVRSIKQAGQSFCSFFAGNRPPAQQPPAAAPGR